MIAEGLAASHNIIYIDTVTPRVSIGTLTYAGGIANTAMWVSSNVVISSGPTGGNNFIVLYATGSICFGGNGTCQTSFSAGTLTSSSTQLSGNFTSNARTGPCIAGSTVTFTLGGSQKIFFSASAQAFGIDSASVWAISVPIIDGVLPTGYDNTTGYQASFGISAGYRVPLSIFYLATSAAASGSHTACLSIGTNAGAGGTTTLVGPVRISAGGM